MVVFTLDGQDYPLPPEWGEVVLTIPEGQNQMIFNGDGHTPYTGQPYIPIIWAKGGRGNIFRCAPTAVDYYLSNIVADYRVALPRQQRGKWRWQW